MYPSNDVIQHQYANTIDAIKRQNKEIKRMTSLRSYRWSEFVSSARASVKSNGIQGLRPFFSVQKRVLKDSILSRSPKYPPVDQITVAPPNYILTERIAVYTCITGGYDNLHEPLIRADNCDYYAITDSQLSPASVWKRIHPDLYAEYVIGLSPAYANRFFRLHPDLLFPDHQYSLYLDGNILLCTDPTEYINRIYNPYGMAFFMHPQRNCVYDEAITCVRQSKDTKEHMQNATNYLRSKGMPENYGLLNTGLIARKHHDLFVKEIMADWWDHYLSYPNRDQVTLPYVLYRHGVHIKDVGILGVGAEFDDGLRIVSHNMY